MKTPFDALEGYFEPHPHLLGVELMKFFGHSIIRGWMLPCFIEVMDPGGETHQFENVDQFNDFMSEQLPGCFIGEL